ncbi:EAL domain-containing protein [Hahella sp. SMD15-11]|uniref:EAL domain-containing protein n=1 Tax=Thermohahella caldifontis TaxID=3142973 RepID=A0AB39UWD0_9GAMM
MTALLNEVLGEPVPIGTDRVSVRAVAGFVSVTARESAATSLIAAAKSAADDAARQEKRVVAGHLDDQVQARRERVLAEVARIHDKLDNERLLLRCQKIIPLKADTALGPQYEILLSIHDSQGQLIPAVDFVRAAEQYNRMQDVDRWVVGRVLDWMVANRSRIESLGGISINLSGHSLNDEVLLEYIFEKLTHFDCPLDKITFEITEASAITQLADVVDFINELHEYGAHFCLGNFGTGVSSVQFLKQLPVDMIKIDGSFIRDLHTDKNDQLMVRSMTEMAHFLGKEVVAPHVEHREVVTTLKMLGVDYAQGFHIERPRQLDTL